VTPALRPYSSGDFDTLYEIDQACYPPGIAYTKRMMRWFLKVGGAECIVAEAEGRVAGFIILHYEAGSGHIVTLDVLAACRRRGIGSHLLHEAERRLAAKGAQRIELETATDNAPAIAFWLKHGYRKRSVIPRYYLDRVDAYWMEKLLARPGSE
jgi:ribosomal-protein-alanine N-acetyltransferase